ncbi:integrase [Vibrio coralliilyticus]|uniref:tyrosine-type recombinase/integrase n=1 Tax=Vibrio coralliilyticus TaxID=190893 RepID=UPI000810E962|nr:integrase family protein [Vibrio coralliilyticus]ANW25925.1 integrase [Vibrio coralliilyticus]
MAVLTKSHINSLRPRQNKYTVNDTGTGSVSGLRITVQPSGKKTWVVYYKTGKTMSNGRAQQKSVTLGSVDTISLDSARKQAMEIAEKTMDASAYLKRRAVEAFEAERNEIDYIKPSVKELFEAYIKDRVDEGTKSVAKIEGYLLRRMPSQLLSMEAREVTMSDVEEALDREFKKDSGWNMALCFVKAAFGFARGTAKMRTYFGLPEYNSIADIRRKRRKIQTGYIPTLADLAQVWVECENFMTPHSANLCRAIIAGCGSRPNEIQNRKWDDIKFVKHDDGDGVSQHIKLLMMPETKMDKPHSIVISELMWGLIKKAHSLKDTVGGHQRDWIFPSSNPYLSECVSTAGIANSLRLARSAGKIDCQVTMKHVRHAFSTVLGDNGVRADVIARCQNHSLGSRINERHYGRSVFIAEKLEGTLVWERLLKEAISEYQAKKEAERTANEEMLELALLAS